MIEVFGFTTAILVADAAAKAADVQIIALDSNKPAAGDSAEVPLVMIVKIVGTVSDVQSAMDVGIQLAKDKSLYITSHLITRQEPDTQKLAIRCSVGRDKF